MYEWSRQWCFHCAGPGILSLHGPSGLTRTWRAYKGFPNASSQSSLSLPPSLSIFSFEKKSDISVLRRLTASSLLASSHCPSCPTDPTAQMCGFTVLVTNDHNDCGIFNVMICHESNHGDPEPAEWWNRRDVVSCFLLYQEIENGRPSVSASIR